MKKISPRNGVQGYDIFMIKNIGGADFTRGNNLWYDKLRQTYPVLVNLAQEHKNLVLKVDNGNLGEIQDAFADGMFTVCDGIALGILTADCYPVILTGNKGCAALHCGWRSTASGIIENAVRMFTAVHDYPEYAFIGAGISSVNYEVKEDFIEQVAAYISPDKFLHKRDGKTYFDLESVITFLLKESGVKRIESSGVCTYNDKECYSYRRDNGKTGRMITVVHKNKKG